MENRNFSRRRLLSASGLSLGGLALTGCDSLTDHQGVQNFIGRAEGLNFSTQRFLQGRDALATEFSEADISPIFKANGTRHPDTDIYKELVDTDFASWRLVVDGLVTRPLSLSMADLNRLPSRTQITRHDCVEGWSAIGKWTGTPLGLVLKAAGLKPNARYVVFHCADELEKTLDGSGQYYESVDLIDAFHPQTILAHSLNGKPLTIGNGAPLRLRVERQLGYKQAKYLMRIEVVDSFRNLAGGKGGFWEDRGYEWYAGI